MDADYQAATVKPDCGAVATNPSVGMSATLIFSFDLVLLFCLIMADVRAFQGSEVASFTLFELFIWIYCAPVALSGLLIERQRLPPMCQAFLLSIGVYVAWLLFVSGFWIVFKGDAGVLQNTKNIVPALVLVAFLFVRVRSMGPILLLCNLYLIYAVMACLVGILQYKYGAPYFRDLVAGTEYKTDIEGAEILSPVVGFSGHPNQFAMSILPAVVFAMVTLIAELRNRGRVRWITLFATLVLSVGLMLSQARGAMVFTVAAILFILSPLGRTRQFWVKLVWVGGLITAIVLYGMHQAQTGAVGGSDTIEVRYLLWQTSIDAMLSNVYILLFGDGMGYVLDWSQSIAGWKFPDAHNAWIDQMLFFGLPAIAFYLMIWQSFFRVVETTAVRRLVPDQVVLNGLRASIMALMGDYFFEPVAHAVFPISQLFLLMALAVRAASFMAD